MELRVSVITLGVKDLDLSRRFYVEGLRWALEWLSGDRPMAQEPQHHESFRLAS